MKSKFYLSNGGIGDFLLLLSTFYDNAKDTTNVVFFANNKQLITRTAKLFPKIKTLVVENSFTALAEFVSHNGDNILGTGITPKELDYSTWYKVDICKEYGVVEFPQFLKELFYDEELHNKNYATVQMGGSSSESDKHKRRVLTPLTYDNIQRECARMNREIIKIDNTKDMLQTFKLLVNSSSHYGVDSFGKTVTAMCGINTVVYDNLCTAQYLSNFKDQIDYGHYVFIFPFSKIELRQQ
jgi:hypothetical protein